MDVFFQSRRLVDFMGTSGYAIVDCFREIPPYILFVFRMYPMQAYEFSFCFQHFATATAYLNTTYTSYTFFFQWDKSFVAFF